MEHAECNGRKVMILEYHADCQKYSVYLDEGPVKTVKPEHLSLHHPGGSSSARPPGGGGHPRLEVGILGGRRSHRMMQGDGQI